ncbi:hypothetical protein Ancab_039908 [Ancistrocladus abbreviatus]
MKFQRERRSMRGKRACYLMLPFWSSMSTFIFISACIADDSINVTHSIKDGDTLVSANGNFELGFFSPGDPERRYVGIWYKKIPVRTVIWVANRETPLLDSSGVLKLIENPGILVLVNGSGGVIWSTSATRFTQNPIVQLLDSGNLIVREKDAKIADDFLWQSFDHPCDIQMPGMKLGWNLVTGLNRYLTSWKSSDDPSLGNYTYEIDRRGYPQPVLMKGSVEQYRNGPWNGVRFDGNPNLKSNSIYTINFVLNDKEMYYVYELLNSSVISHRLLNQYGTMQRVIWSDHDQAWTMYSTAQKDECDMYAACGVFGSCNIASTPQCTCLRGFKPKSEKDWDAGVWSEGCVRATPLSCVKGDGFIKYSNVKLPDTRYSWYNRTMSLEECQYKCLENCSCVAYANLYITDGGSGCLLWIDVLIDIEVFGENGQDLYVRVAASELTKKNKRTWIIVACILVAALLLIVSIISLAWRKRMLKRRVEATPREENYKNVNNEEEPDLPLFNFNMIVHATNNFSDDNKLGEGGFGPVYKGVLRGGQEIAVKRLSKDSKQGADEFENEVQCIAKLQHRNLVKLFGCCIQAGERILIYEYMPNQSVDFFIFDKTRRVLLDWPKRVQIINGIARGLLYLHQDSRMRIVHRDLKASNVLLDSEMNPKISDFGMARIFDGNECEAKTNRVVGTYGYMPPEYAIDGHFSVKSDVFSFGVIVLEIISGKRNRGFNHQEHSHNLLGHAWRLFLEGKSLELIDPVIGKSYNASQALKSIHIALLCVQYCPEDRPSMSSVIVMLESDCELAQPKMPGFFVERNMVEQNSSESFCSNEITRTTLASGR